MGVSLITPAGSNFLKNWPAQNTVNSNSVDAYAGPCLITHPLQTYAPQFRGTTTNPTLGTGGLIRGFFYQIFDQIYTWGEFRFGTSGINVGSGTYSITLPFTADTSVVPANTISARGAALGEATIWDNDTVAGRSPEIVHLRTSTEIQFSGPNGISGSELVNSGGPIAWAVSDGITWFARYKRLP